jgi:hypothetical protein
VTPWGCIYWSRYCVCDCLTTASGDSEISSYIWGNPGRCFIEIFSTSFEWFTFWCAIVCARNTILSTDIECIWLIRVIKKLYRSRKGLSFLYLKFVYYRRNAHIDTISFSYCLEFENWKKYTNAKKKKRKVCTHRKNVKYLFKYTNS